LKLSVKSDTVILTNHKTSGAQMEKTIMKFIISAARLGSQ
jgi:hypothetical protein